MKSNWTVFVACAAVALIVFAAAVLGGANAAKRDAMLSARTVAAQIS